MNNNLLWKVECDCKELAVASQQSSPEAIARQFWNHWRRRNKPAVLAMMRDDCVFALCIPQDVLPFGVVTQGKPSISDRLQSVIDAFDTVRYEGIVVKVRADSVYGCVDYCYRHKNTGEVFDGTMRQIIQIEDGLIVDWKVFTDVERVRAFMRLVAYAAA